MTKPTDTRAPAVKLDEDAWRAGFVSGNLGKDEKCPFPPTCAEALAWSSGRIEGADRPRGTLPQLRPIKPPAA